MSQPGILAPCLFPDSHEAIFEVGPEPRRLVALRLPVLNRTPTQVFVHLGDVDGRRALLVHRGGLANPEVDVGGLVRAPALTYLLGEHGGKRVRSKSKLSMQFCRLDSQRICYVGVWSKVQKHPFISYQLLKCYLQTKDNTKDDTLGVSKTKISS